MALHFHPLTIKKIRKETADAVSIVFELPDNLKKEFAYTHGQNITLKTTIGKEELRRSYSICSAPFENDLMVAVKKVPEGKFSTFVNDVLQEGMTLDVLPPSGKFNTALHIDNRKQYLAIAAGSGITPIISIIKTTLKTEPNATFTLIYSNKSRSSIMFFEELEGLKNKYLQRFTMLNILSRERTESDVSFGRINKEKLTMLEKLVAFKTMNDVFICGPEEMIFCVKDFLEQKGIDKSHIHFELFASPGSQKKVQAFTQQNSVDSASSNISIQLDGRQFGFDMNLNGGSILDEALKQGADLPFACKGGVCCTCKAKLLEGKVAMDVSWGLEHDEIEQGFILTCQSHPMTDKVVIDFDIR